MTPCLSPNFLLMQLERYVSTRLFNLRVHKLKSLYMHLLTYKAVSEYIALPGANGLWRRVHCKKTCLHTLLTYEDISQYSLASTFPLLHCCERTMGRVQCNKRRYADVSAYNFWHTTPCQLALVWLGRRVCTQGAQLNTCSCTNFHLWHGYSIAGIRHDAAFWTSCNLSLTLFWRRW